VRSVSTPARARSASRVGTAPGSVRDPSPRPEVRSITPLPSLPQSEAVTPKAASVQPKVSQSPNVRFVLPTPPTHECDDSIALTPNQSPAPSVYYSCVEHSPDNEEIEAREKGSAVKPGMVSVEV
jgi:hypothetical protein